MSSNVRRENLHLLLYVFATIGIALTVYSGVSSLFTGRGGIATAALAQTNPFLEQRLNQTEQRLNQIESRINRLEQESRLPIAAPEIPSNNDSEIRLLRSQIDILQLRIAELECAAVKLDERTLTEAARRAQRKSASSVSDPCRESANEPLKLSARPS